MLAGSGATAATNVVTYMYAPSGLNAMPCTAASIPGIVIVAPMVFVS